MSRSVMKSILLAAPGELRRAAMGAALSDRRFRVVISAKSLQDALARIDSQRIDLMVFERRGTGDAELNSLRSFKEQRPRCGVLMLARNVSHDELLDLFDAGVDAVVDRRVSLQSLVSYADLVLSGERALQPILLETDRTTSGPEEPRPARAYAPLLSNREHAVVNLLAAGLTDKEIARHLDLVHGTVRNYVRSVQQKLSLANRTQVAVWALQHGVVNSAVADLGDGREPAAT